MIDFDKPVRFRGSVEERFWQHTAVAGPDECWLWKLRPTSRGYGRMTTPLGSSTPAHRVSVLLSGREIPDDHVVDHICRNRMCVNPSHLRVVTPKINGLENNISPPAMNAKRTHCSKGHEFNETNSFVSKRGWRVCRPCQELRDAEYRARKGQRNFKRPEFRHLAINHIEGNHDER